MLRCGSTEKHGKHSSITSCQTELGNTEYKVQNVSPSLLPTGWTMQEYLGKLNTLLSQKWYMEVDKDYTNMKISLIKYFVFFSGIRNFFELENRKAFKQVFHRVHFRNEGFWVSLINFFRFKIITFIQILKVNHIFCVYLFGIWFGLDKQISLSFGVGELGRLDEWQIEWKTDTLLDSFNMRGEF